MVEMRLLQAAVAVAEERNVTRAADRLGITQPALSKQLAELEERVGTVLFERSSQRFEVTDAGAAFVEHGRIALAEAERAVQSARSVSLGAQQVVCVSKSPYVDPYIVSVFRSIRLPLHPKLDVRFSSHFSGEATRLLRSGESDFAITIGLTEPPGVSSVVLAEDCPFAALQASDPLSARRELSLFDLHQHRLTLFERNVNPTMYDRIQKILAEEGIQPTEIQHVQQAEESAALILERRSIGLMSKTGAWRDLR